MISCTTKVRGEGMQQLPFDITRCVTDTCPRRSTCKRWLLRYDVPKEDEGVTPYCDFTYFDRECDNHIPRLDDGWISNLYNTSSKSPLDAGTKVELEYGNPKGSEGNNWVLSRSGMPVEELPKVALAEDVDWGKVLCYRILGGSADA